VLILQFINNIDLEMKFHAKFAQSANRHDTFFMCESERYEASQICGNFLYCGYQDLLQTINFFIRHHIMFLIFSVYSN